MLQRSLAEERAGTMVEFCIIAAAITGVCVAVVGIFGLNVWALFESALANIPF